MPILCFIGMILVLFIVVVTITKKRETFINNKLPVSQDTIDYIQNNASNKVANQLFAVLQGQDKSVKVPTPFQGTLLDTPNTYTSWWS